MKAVAFEHSRPISAEDSLINIELHAPEPRHHDLLVEVKAVSVNPVDVKIRRYDDPLGVPRILGFDAAGIVRGVGAEVTQFGVGDEVIMPACRTGRAATRNFIWSMSALSGASRDPSPLRNRRRCR